MNDRALVIFIVDDDAPSRQVAAFPFTDPAFEVHQFASGEACLAALDKAPDIILLDVEMPAPDGLATCRALRAAGENRAQVIFISLHNDLETRLRAYDAGGSDYIVKPVSPPELAQKVALAKQTLRRQQGLEEQVAQASQTAFAAMSSMGEIGIVLQFLRASFACETAPQLAGELINALRHYGLDGMLELHLAENDYCASSQGACTPLERSILNHAHNMERVFQFHDRLVINYPAITLVASRLPLADPAHVGRLRDSLAILAEGANARLLALTNEKTRLAQARGIGQALGDLSAALEVVETQQSNLKLSALVVMDQYILDQERAFIHLGLSQEQENSLSSMAHRTAEQIGQLLGDSKEVSDRLHGVAVGLRQLVVS